MTDHLADLGLDDQVPDGWYFGDLGYSYFTPDEESGMETYLAKIAEYGPDGRRVHGLRRAAVRQPADGRQAHERDRRRNAISPTPSGRRRRLHRAR